MSQAHAKHRRDLEVITTHLNADFDALASMLAASRLYPQAQLVMPGAKERGLRDFFVESATYLYNFVRLKDLDFSRVKRLIVVDTRHAERIGPLAPLAADPEVEVHLYDHHPATGDEMPADLEVVAPVGSCVTLLSWELKNRGITLGDEEATLLALGIYEDTGSFSFISTTSHDFEAAAWLVSQGADLNTVANLITREMTKEEVRLLNDLIKEAETLDLGGVRVMVTAVSRKEYVPELAVLIHKMMDMENPDALFALARMEGRIYLVGRSRKPEVVDASEVVGVMGGGGHASAASASLKDMPLVEARERLRGILTEKLARQRTARDLMTSPVISCPPEMPLRQAEELLTRYNINVLVVMGPEGPVEGIITRQTVEKAIFHSLGELAVEEYMNPTVEPLPPDASLLEVEKAVLEKRQRLVTVVEDGRLVGVITRTDLLNTLIEDPLVHDKLFESDQPLHPRQKKMASLLAERLPRDIFEILRQFGQVADQLGMGAYLVGGAVRDLLLRQGNLDLDVVVEGDGIGFAKAFAQAHPGVAVRSHQKFNTAKLSFPGDLTIDVATARLEYYQSPASLPTVELSSLKLDLYRRDFTINTLALQLNHKQFGRLIDFFEGLRDLKDKAIRVLHNLSFVEDPTRILRAVRFEQRFGFRIGRLTEGLIKNAVKIDAFKRLSGKRLFHELRQLLEEEKAVDCILRLRELGLLKVLHPKLRLEPHQIDLLDQADDALAWYHLSYLGKPVRGWLIYLLTLADSLEDLEAMALFKRLAIAPRVREEALAGRGAAQGALHRLQRGFMPDSQVYFLLQPLKLEYLLFVMAKAKQPWAKRAVSSYLTTLCKVRPELDGEGLKAMGFVPGPLFKTILDRLQAARLDGQTKNRDDEIALVRAEFWPDHATES